MVSRNIQALMMSTRTSPPGGPMAFGTPLEEKAFGQPKPQTHPHLLKSDELTIGITAKEYQDRRAAVVRAIGKGSIAAVPGYGLRYVSNGIFYPFHQATNFLYLTGFNEPDAGCIIGDISDALTNAGSPANDTKSKNSPKSRLFTMFVQPADRETEIWDGPRAGMKGAMTHFGADLARQVDSFESNLKVLDQNKNITTIYSDLPLTLSKPVTLLEGTNVNVSSKSAVHVDSDSSFSKALVHSTMGRPPVLHHDETSEAKHNFLKSSSSSVLDTLTGWMHGHKTRHTTTIKPFSNIIDSIRLFKSQAEVALMREAGRISGRAFVKAMRYTSPGVTEHQISAILEYESKMMGASGLAYVPVVASGKNSLTLHYVQNQQILRDGDLVLVDAGAEYGGYASDITRTWPVNGKFSQGQKHIYEIVLEVQKRLISRCCEASNTTLDELQHEATALLQEKLAILFGRSISISEINTLYPHHVGHWLGMDVHDTPTIRRNVKLVQGMVVTIEPGLYIPDSLFYPEIYRGIGIRIEDDIAVGGPSTGGSPIVLSADTPKEIVDIEAVMAGIV
ncbi:hypothetical protein BASA83_006664 [Batrachochytrium salamandrivorans]|nr:hypothetical protein BASA83_006664 [Batrachochytrium salamandrivorans]